MTVCATCSSPISPLARADARFCSSRCRVAAHRALPAEQLRLVDRWVRWSKTKVPLTTFGAAASSTNPDTWTSYDDAIASDAGVGIGFVLSNVDRIVCVDIDDCLDGRGRLDPFASVILADVPDTYIEVSPSGRGLHVWGFGDVVAGRVTSGLEVYGTGRYITVTGRRWHKCPTAFAELDEWLVTLPA